MQPEKVKAWRKAFEQGIAFDLCDRILESREIPPKLAGVIAVGRSSHMGVKGIDKRLTTHLLTRRQQEIVHLLAAGWRGPKIAEALGITLETFKAHVKSAMAVMDARNQTHLVAQAMRYCEIV